MNVLLSILVVLIPAFVLIAALWLTRQRGKATAMVLLGTAAGESELALWKSALRAHGLGFRTASVGALHYYYGQTLAGDEYEVWVRARDVAAARAALGW